MFFRTLQADEKRRLESLINELEEEKEDLETSLEMMDEKIRKLTVSLKAWCRIAKVVVKLIGMFGSVKSDNLKREELKDSKGQGPALHKWGSQLRITAYFFH